MKSCNFLRLIYNKVTSRSYGYFLKFLYFYFLRKWFFQLCQKLQSLVRKISQGTIGIKDPKKIGGLRTPILAQFLDFFNEDLNCILQIHPLNMKENKLRVYIENFNHKISYTQNLWLKKYLLIQIHFEPQ